MKKSSESAIGVIILCLDNDIYKFEDLKIWNLKIFKRLFQSKMLRKSRILASHDNQLRCSKP